MLGSFSESSLEEFSEMLRQSGNEDYSEFVASYDFTRCVRPDGSAYGTGGQCKKGREGSARKKAPSEAQTTTRKLNIGKAQSESQRNQHAASLQGKDYDAYMAKHSPRATGNAEKMNKVAADAKKYAAERAKLHRDLYDQSFAPKDAAYEKKLQSQLNALEKKHLSSGLLQRVMGR